MVSPISQVSPPFGEHRSTSRPHPQVHGGLLGGEVARCRDVGRVDQQLAAIGGPVGDAFRLVAAIGLDRRGGG